MNPILFKKQLEQKIYSIPKRNKRKFAQELIALVERAQKDDF